MIRVLDDVEHVRTRPGMYIGGYNTRGLHHLVYEIVDNSIDEALAGYCKQILVKINADGSCTVVDDGRGIPVGIHPTEHIPTVEVVFATLNAGVEIVFEDERVGNRDVFKYERGLAQYIAFLNEGKQATSPIISFTKTEPQARLELEIAMQYNDGYNETILSFANNINNHIGGTHLSGFKTGLTNTILRYAERANLLKDVRPTGDDLREGLVAVISVKIPEPQFESQTKDKLLNVEVESFMQTSMNERLASFLEENPKDARAIFEKGMMAAEAREAARKARELTRRKNSLEGNSLPGKLADCRSKSNEETEVFLVEGDSAGGTVKQGPDSNVQAGLGPRGKTLNVEKEKDVKKRGHGGI